MVTSSFMQRASTPSGWEPPIRTSCWRRRRTCGYSALALTDTNLCGALEFARLANSLGIRPITGGELTLTDGTRLTLLARTRAGYSNVSRLFTTANAADRREPRLDPALLIPPLRRRHPADGWARWAALSKLDHRWPRRGSPPAV